MLRSIFGLIKIGCLVLGLAGPAMAQNLGPETNLPMPRFVSLKASESNVRRGPSESGVIARLGECNATWCRLTAGGYRGWAPKSVLWGVKPDELRD